MEFQKYLNTCMVNIKLRLTNDNDYLFKEAQKMNIDKLTLPYFYDSILEKIKK